VAEHRFVDEASQPLPRCIGQRLVGAEIQQNWLDVISYKPRGRLGHLLQEALPNAEIQPRRSQGEGQQPANARNDEALENYWAAIPVQPRLKRESTSAFIGPKSGQR
jgi:hypothetical protein